MNIIPNVDVNDSDNGVISFFQMHIPYKNSLYGLHVLVWCTGTTTSFNKDSFRQNFFYFGSTRRSSSGKRIMGSGKEISRAARSSHREGGSSFVETWRKFGRGAVARTNGRGWRRGEGVLYPYP